MSLRVSRRILSHEMQTTEGGPVGVRGSDLTILSSGRIQIEISQHCII